ncbi:hypothetical protein [Streptomyces javensis]|uniref:Uncharacterized protein n=1 Tax=Streptomyces javensis TaxID=114698 RepID=A0ABS0R5X0_9ACTN|nr:hypothetical protein [Streptomyces javensis]MBI0312705.1 hypothetical protein [Streptomyces javensis]
MQTQTVGQAVAAVHTHLDALHGEDHDHLAPLLADLVAAARSGDQRAVDAALAEIHLDRDALHPGPHHDDLAEVLADVVTAAQAAATGA